MLAILGRRSVSFVVLAIGLSTAACGGNGSGKLMSDAGLTPDGAVTPDAPPGAPPCVLG